MSNTRGGDLPDPSAPIRFEVLGPLRASRDDRELDLGPAKQRAVLAVLLVNANRAVSSITIIDAVWRDDPPANGPNVVQKHIAGLRRILEPERSARTVGGVITLTDAGYVLNVEAGALDVDAFDRLVAQARSERASADVDTLDEASRARLEHASELLRTAVALHRAAPLAGLSGPVIDAARDRYAENLVAALETRADIDLTLGRHDELVPELTDLAAAHPVRERLRWLLMLALYRAGRQAEALATYREAQRFLDHEFGVQPGAALTQLHQRILRSDPNLIITQETTPPPAMPVDLTAPPLAIGPAAIPTIPTMPETPPTLVRRAGRILGITFAALICVASFGFLSWAAIGYHAAYRRSRALAWCTAAYFIAPFVTITMMDIGDPRYSGLLVGGFLLQFCVAVVGFVHVILLNVRSAKGWFAPRAAPGQPLGTYVAGPPQYMLAPPMQSAHQFEVDRRIRRQRAREILATNPDTARRMLIGAPHLVRTYDDGGLIDINAVPEQILSMMLGLSPQHAHLIAIDRFTRGPFRNTEELVTRGLLDPYTVSQLQEYLIVVPGPPLPSSALA